ISSSKDPLAGGSSSDDVPSEELCLHKGQQGQRTIKNTLNPFGNETKCDKSVEINVREKEKKMGRLFVVTLEGSIYSCKHCKTHLGLSDDIISKVYKSHLPSCNWKCVSSYVIKNAFHSRHGKAYLFDKVVNVTVGEKEERMMITGMHTVVDIFCVGCGSIVGWKYVLGPDGSMYVLGQEVQVGGSDADDAFRLQ
ncbi:hypothetical protein Ccrd_003117, partial [Cynara cardunculus var. scolymus]